MLQRSDFFSTVIRYITATRSSNAGFLIARFHCLSTVLQRVALCAQNVSNQGNIPQTLSLVGLIQPMLFTASNRRWVCKVQAGATRPRAIAHRLPHDAALRYLCTTPLSTEQLLLAYFLLSWIARRLVYKALPLGVFLLFFYPSTLCILFSF